MPRNGSGNFSLPAINSPVVDGTLITASNFNAITADLSTAITNSIATNGESVVTGNIPMSGYRMTGMGNGVLAQDSATVGQVTLSANLAASTGSSLVGHIATGTGAVARTVKQKLDDIVSVKDFGAVGDGVTDDRNALLNAITAAAGRDVILESGEVYLIGSAIVYNGDVSIRSSGAEPAVIFQNGQLFYPLTISGTLFKTTTLSGAVQINKNNWSVTDITGVIPGMLMEVISDTLWYHDPRGVAMKSELHRVGRIDAGILYTEDPSNDGYDVGGTEIVTVKFYTPVSVRLENITIRCVLPAPVVDADRVFGIVLEWANEPRLIDVNIENAAAAGIQPRSCYRPVIIGGYSHGSNNYNNGYGVQFYGCSHGLVKDRTFWQCRRGVDVSGGVIISRHTTIENCTNLGGGFNSEGTKYGWNNDGTLGAAQYGFGSHGPADHTIYRGNRVASMYSHINIRGRNEVIEDNYFIGQTYNGSISLGFGENVKILNNKLYSGWESMKDDTIRDGGGVINSRRADLFVYVMDSYQGGEIVIDGNDVEVQAWVVEFMLGATRWNNIDLKNNKFNFAPVSGIANTYLFWDTNVATTVSNWNISNNTRRSSSTGSHLLFPSTISLDETCRLNDGSSYSNEWTTTATAVTNVASVTPSQGVYSRVGNMVSFALNISITATAANADTVCRISLPVASNFVSTANAIANGVSSTFGIKQVCSGIANTTADEIDIRLYPSVDTAVAYQITGSYDVR